MPDSIDPTLQHRFVGGPLDGKSSADLPAALSEKSLRGTSLKIPLGEPRQYSLFARYDCLDEAQRDGYWIFQFSRLLGPNDEELLAAPRDTGSSDSVENDAEWLDLAHLAEWSRTRSRVRGLVVGYCLGDALARTQMPADRFVPGNAASIALAALEGTIGAKHRAAVRGIGGWLGAGAWAGVVRWAVAAGIALRPEAAHVNSDFWRPRWTATFPGYLQRRGSSARGLREALGPVAPSLPNVHEGTFKAPGDHIVARLILIGAALVDPIENPGFGVDRVIFDNARHSHSPRAQACGAVASLLAHRALLSGELSLDLSARGRLPRVEPPPMLDGAFHEVLHDLGIEEDGPIVRPSGQGGPAERTLKSGYRLAYEAMTSGVDAILERTVNSTPGEVALAMGLFGAVKGIEALPQDALAKLDLGWLADRLALDAVDLSERISEANDHENPHTNAVFGRRYNLS